MSQPSKFCVFCGQRPHNKTKEHVLPLWLIKRTGDPNRTVQIGFPWVGQKPKREFAFDQLQFPACHACNESFGQNLENRAKVVIERLLGRQSVKESELDTLLDWLDKVRTGLWLGSLALNGNLFGIKPKFFIRDRIGMHDRMAAIYETNYAKGALSFLGTDLPGFVANPSCFALLINDLAIFSVSYQFLFSKRLGLPHLMHCIEQPDGRFEGEIEPGSGQVSLPLLPAGTVASSSLEIYQPSFTPIIDYRPELFDHPAALAWRRRDDQRRSLVLANGGSGVEPWPERGRVWSRTGRHDAIALRNSLSRQTVEWQNRLLEDMPSFEALSPDEAERRQRWFDEVKRTNKALLEECRPRLVARPRCRPDGDA